MYDDDECITDRKFAVKARLYQALGVTLSVIRSYLHSPKILQSLVSVLKLYATDGELTQHLHHHHHHHHHHLSFQLCTPCP